MGYSDRYSDSMGKLREILEHPDELVPLVQMAIAAKRVKVLPKDRSLAFCYDMLNRVSRRSGSLPYFSYKNGVLETRMLDQGQSTERPSCWKQLCHRDSEPASTAA